MPTAPRVFISYSHDNAEHQAMVLELAQQLRRDGIFAELDQFHVNQLLNWPRWCYNQMRPENTDYVLCICTAEYVRRVESEAENSGKGVYWEGGLAISELFNSKVNRRYVPLLLDGATAENIPIYLHGYTYFQLDQFGLEESPAKLGYRNLYRLLTGQASIIGEAVGELHRLEPVPEGEKRTDFLGLMQQIKANTIAIRDTQTEHSQLLQRILHQAASYRHDGVLHQLPSPPEHFTGRTDEIVELLAALRHPLPTNDRSPDSAGAPSGLLGTHSIIISAVNGLGGVGKTALATMAAYALVDDYPDLQLFLPLRTHSPQPRTAEQVRDSVLQALNPESRLPDDEDTRWMLYRKLFDAEDGKPCAALVVLDDVADDQQVKLLKPPPPGVVLVTSRRQLQSGLSLHLDRMVREDSINLLIAYAPRLQANQADLLAKLCGDLPVALRIAGGVLKCYPSRPVAEYLDELQQDRLEGLRGDSTEDDVSRVFAASWRYLTVPEQQAFAALSIFQSHFSRDAGKAIIAAALRPRWWARLLRRPVPKADNALDRLVHLNLLEYNDTTQRFDWHDLVREYASRQLMDEEELTVRLAHADFYIAVAQQSQELYLQGHEAVKQGLDLFDLERAQIEIAFAWLSNTTYYDARVIDLVGGVSNYSFLRFHPRQRIAWYQVLLNAAQQFDNQVAIGIALGGLGLAWADLGKSGQAKDYFEQALVIAHDINDRRGESVALGSLGNVWKALGEPRKAIEYLEQSLVIGREIGDRRNEGNTLGNLGNAWAALGEHSKSIDYYEQQLVIVREIGDRRGEGSALCNLGNAWAGLGKPSKAIDYNEQALVIFREIGDRRDEGNVLVIFALVYHRIGETVEAINRAEAALAIYEAIEDPNAAKVRAKLAEWRGQG